MGIRSLLCAFVCLLGASNSLVGQATETERTATGRILGRLVDGASGQPVEGVSVRMTDTGELRITDSQGRFVFAAAPQGVRELLFEHIGYGRVAHLVNVITNETVVFEAELRTDAVELNSLVIVARARVSNLARVGFYDRESRGWGKFFSGEDISYYKLRQALYSVPYVQFAESGSTRRVLMRHAGRTCIPDIYLDGVKQRYAEGEVETVVGGLDLEAMEVYRGISTPSEFFSACGAILLWRRQ